MPTDSLHHEAGTDLASSLHQLANDFGQESQVRGTASSSGGQGRQGAILWLLDSGEADVVLLDDGRVQAVEVEQQHKLVVQAFLGLQHKAPGILRGAPLLTPTCHKLMELMAACLTFTGELKHAGSSVIRDAMMASYLLDF